MTSLARAVIAVVLFLSLAADHASAQERGPGVLRLPASTRALGMGHIFPVGSTDSDGIFYHAAFPDRLRGASVAGQWWGSRASLYTASGAIDWWNGALAFGVRALDYGGALAGGLAPVSGEGALRHAVAEVVSERALSVAYARRVKGVRGAVTAHLAEQRLQSDRTLIPAIDLGLGAEFTLVGVGLSARNLGPAYTVRTRDVALPIQIQLSAAGLRALPVGELDLLPALSLLYEVAGELLPAAGIEISYWPVPGRLFSLRLGARRPDEDVRAFTAGAGFTGDRIILDYAVVPLEGDRFVHRFGLRWR